jgi:hypothetical protein
MFCCSRNLTALSGADNDSFPLIERKRCEGAALLRSNWELEWRTFLRQAVSFQESGEGKHDWAQGQRPRALNSGTVRYRRGSIELHAYWQAVIRSESKKNETYLSIMALHRVLFCFDFFF